ncbi:MAG: hypothetical protein WCP52_02205 [Bacteroidota bacterium]
MKPREKVKVQKELEVQGKVLPANFSKEKSANLTDITNLIFLLKRVFENYLELKPDEIAEEDMFQLARKAEAKKLGENLNNYYSNKFLNYSWDCMGFYMELEQALDIQIYDLDTDNINTFSELAFYLNDRLDNKLINDKLKIYPKYFDSLLANRGKLKILFIGRDPYPNDPMGIPFCKNDLKESRKPNCSGRYLLNGFGTDILSQKYNNIKNTEDIFMNLVTESGVGLVNASYFPIGKLKPMRYQIKLSNYLNQLLYAIPDTKVLLTRGAEKLLRRKDKPLDSGYKLLEVPGIQMPIKESWRVVCHPDFRNSRRDDHKYYWQEKSGMLRDIA